MLLIGLWGWILVQAPTAWAREGKPQDCPEENCLLIGLSPTVSPGGEGQRVCSGPYGVGAVFQEGNRWAEGQILLGCAGNIVERRRFADYAADFCPTPLGAWLELWDKDPASGVGLGAGLCRLMDYSGQPVELVIRVPPHRFHITPWPMGFVAREDPWGCSIPPPA
ncbi:hypothetical protein [Thermoflexus sp.]|uniref:hypothetical protein n=1 Tax=Thermoflexus sp. TaxID=1969742 RepID=UPI0035E40A26